jgi:hypothetical protein
MRRTGTAGSAAVSAALGAALTAALVAQATRLATVAAPFGAVFTLFVIIAGVALLTVGWRLAVARRYTAHAIVQTGAVVAITAVAVVWMVVSLVRNVLPQIPAHLGQATYAVDTAHATIGAVAAVFGAFVVLAAAKVLPARLRFRAFRPFMRAAYGLYLVAAAAGVALFVVAYGLSLR